MALASLQRPMIMACARSASWPQVKEISVRPLRIATLHSNSGGSFLLRCQAPLKRLQAQGAVTVVSPLMAWEADVVLFHDQWQPGSLDVMRSLQQHGIKWWWMWMETSLLHRTQGFKNAQESCWRQPTRYLCPVMLWPGS